MLPSKSRFGADDLGELLGELRTEEVLGLDLVSLKEFFVDTRLMLAYNSRFKRGFLSLVVSSVLVLKICRRSVGKF